VLVQGGATEAVGDPPRGGSEREGCGEVGGVRRYQLEWSEELGDCRGGATPGADGSPIESVALSSVLEDVVALVGEAIEDLVPVVGNAAADE
jgi:hypothetical protein